MATTLETLVVKINADTTSIQRSLNRLERTTRQSSRRMARSFDTFDNRVANLNRTLATAGRLLGGFAGVQGLQRLVSALGDASDTYRRIEGQLKLVTASERELSTVHAALFDIAQRTRTEFESTAELYARMARSSDELGLSQGQLLTLTESVNQAMLISGGSAASAQAALVQLGQAMATGVLRGEELNSVMGQSPRLARAIAEGMGITVGELRALGKEGELTAARVIEAILSQAETLRDEYAQVPETIEQSNTRLGNSFDRFLVAIDQATGATAAWQGALGTLATQLDAVALAINDVNAGLLVAANALAAAGFGDAAGAIRAGVAARVQAERNATGVADPDRVGALGGASIEELRRWLESERRNVESFERAIDEMGVTDAAVRRRYNDAVATRDAVQSELNRRLSAPAPVSSGGGSSGGRRQGQATEPSPIEDEIDHFQEWIDGMNERIAALGRERTALDMSDVAARAYLEAEEAIAELRREGIELTPQQEAQIRALATAYAEGEAQLEGMARQQQLVEELWQDVGNAAFSAFARAIEGGESLRSVILALISDLLQMQSVQSAIGGLFDGGFDLGGLFGNGGGGRFSGPIGGGQIPSGVGFGTPQGFAAGGNPPVGVPSLVGEDGPELIIPRVASTVVPNHMLGGGATVVQHIAIDARGSQLGVEQRIQVAMRQAKAEAVSEVMAIAGRGGEGSKTLGRRRK